MMDLSFYNNGHKEVFYEKGLMERGCNLNCVKACS